MTVDIASLLELPESETLDFKATVYDLSDARKKRDFAKDIASLANTPREGDAHIVLGVKKNRDGTFGLHGIQDVPDDADLQGIASSLLDPVPRFDFRTVPHAGVTLGLITIKLGGQAPVSPKKSLDPGFEEDTIYFRRGSRNDAASLAERGRIWQWILSSTVAGDLSNPYALDAAWVRYLNEVAGFQSSAKHVLILDDHLRSEAELLTHIGVGPWSFVFDFDPTSDTDGVLSSVRGELESRRSIHVRVKDDPQTTRSPDRTTSWFFVRGLDGRADSMPTDEIRGWRRMYRQILSKESSLLAAELAPATVHVTILWRDGEYSEHLTELLRSLDEALHDLFQPIFVTDAPSSCRRLAEEFDAPVIEMPIRQFASGIQTIFGEDEMASEAFTLPSSSGVPIPLERKVANWIAEEIELVPLKLPTTEDVGYFLRGGTASWTDLDRNIDARRDIQNRLTEAVRRDLEAGRITRISLFHQPGAGGTTVGRRVAWELHDEYPTGLLRRTDPIGTADRIARIYEMTERPVLLVADGTDIADRDLDELAEVLRAGRAPVVIVQIRRREEALRQTGDRSFGLDSMLSDREVARFVNTLSLDVPEQANAIQELGQTANPALHRPVYFALTAYQRDFRVLSEYVQSRVAQLHANQKQAIVFAAIALRYGQRSLPASALRSIFGLSPRDLVDLTSLFSPSTSELFVEIIPGHWRIGHSLVAEELLQQLLATGTDIRTWSNRLADWGIEFIRFCRGDVPVASEEMLDLVRRVFVYRDNLDVLGREQSGQQRFSHFINDVPVSEARVRVLDSLVGSYPEERHFWAHVARFHAIERKDFTQAIVAADHAVQLADHDSVVFHMRGMVRRYEIRELRQSDTVIGDLVNLAEMASFDFERSRSLNPDNDHGYIAEAQMLIELLEHVEKLHGDIFEFLIRRDVPTYLREALDRAESLLAHVRRNREGAGESQYESRASANVRSLYGDYSGAIQRLDSLTSRSDVYQPTVRRLLARAYLSRSGDDWSQMSKSNLNRVLELLARNLEEEPTKGDNIRMWMQASRFQKSPPPIESVFEQVQYWRAEPGSVDATYYACVLSALMAMDGSRTALQQYEQFLNECRELTRFRRNRDRSYEWLGEGSGIARLVHQSRLGSWDPEKGFWENTAPLARVTGRIARISGPQAGLIEFDGGLEAFFVPARSRLSRGDENTRVRAYLGFSYDGPRAWDILLDGDKQSA